MRQPQEGRADHLARLRKTLKSIHAENPSASGPGPLADGLDAQDRVAIESFFDVANARRFQDMLIQNGIGSTKNQQSRRTLVFVDYEDREQARALLQAHLKKYPNAPSRAVRRDFDGLIFGMTIGFSCALIFAVVAWPDYLVFVVAVPFLLVGMIVGHLYDRLRYHIRTSGRPRLGIWELMLLTALPATLIFLRIVIDAIMA